MIDKKKLLCTALVTALTSFFMTKGDKLTSWMAGLTTFLGAFSMSDLGILCGCLLAVISYLTNLYFKIVNRRSLLKRLANGEAVQIMLEEDE